LRFHVGDVRRRVRHKHDDLVCALLEGLSQRQEDRVKTALGLVPSACCAQCGDLAAEGRRVGGERLAVEKKRAVLLLVRAVAELDEADSGAHAF
jgi:hypothetical protein